jgi:chemotaxis protein MotB
MADDGDKPRVIVKKKRAAHGGAHGGAWKVAYADFVTAMMALFMVLWLLTQADLKLRTQIAQYFRDPGVLSGAAFVSEGGNAAKSRDPGVVSKDIIVVQGKAEQELLEGQAKEIKAAIAAAAKRNPELAELKDQVIVQVTDAGLSIQVVDKGRDMLFDLSSADLKPALRKLLENIAPVLERLPNPIHIGGHTDARPFPAGSSLTNWDLSFIRADNARKLLEANGLHPGHIDRVDAFAANEPLVPENPLADENRRLSILAARQGAQPQPAQRPGAAAEPEPEPVVLPPDEIPGQAPAGAAAGGAPSARAPVGAAPRALAPPATAPPATAPPATAPPATAPPAAASPAAAPPVVWPPVVGPPNVLKPVDPHALDDH